MSDVIVSIVIGCITSGIGGFFSYIKNRNKEDKNGNQKGISYPWVIALFILGFAVYLFMVPQANFGSQEIELGDMNSENWGLRLTERNNTVVKLTEIYEESDSVDYSKVGEYQVEVVVKNTVSGISLNRIVNVYVVDTTKPVIDCSTIEVDYGYEEDIDLDLYCDFIDYSGIESVDFDQSKINVYEQGVYSVYVDVLDRNNNKKTEKVDFKVLEMSTEQKKDHVNLYKNDFGLTKGEINEIPIDKLLLTELGDIEVQWSSPTNSNLLSGNTILFDQIIVNDIIRGTFSYKDVTVVNDYVIKQGGIFNVTLANTTLHPGEEYNVVLFDDEERINLSEVIVDFDLSGVNAGVYIFNDSINEYLETLSFKSDGSLKVEEYAPNNLEMDITFFYNEQLITKHIVIESTVDSYNGFDGGSGSSQFPYLISNVTQLRQIGDSQENLDSNYRVLNSIDCLGVPEWIPLGYDGSGNYLDFNGYFDGQGFEIFNVNSTNTIIKINEDKTGFAGFFSKLGSGSKVYNLKLNVNFAFNGESGGDYDHIYVGGIAGYAQNSNIKNISISGVVKFDHLSQKGEITLGGIIGKTEDSVLVAVENHANLIAKRNHNATAGGLIGASINSSLSYAINSGSVSTNTFTGICISGSCTTVDANGGGLIGWVQTSSISYSINIGDLNISGKDRKYGGLFGYMSSTTFSETYYLEGTSSRTYHDTVDSNSLKTDVILKSSTTYASFDNNIWVIVEGQYPTLNTILLYKDLSE